MYLTSLMNGSLFLSVLLVTILTRGKGYRTVFDIDLDALEEKSWQRPGADITDFFNFGFTENSWKQYCQQLVCLPASLGVYASVLLLKFTRNLRWSSSIGSLGCKRSALDSFVVLL